MSELRTFARSHDLIRRSTVSVEAQPKLHDQVGGLCTARAIEQLARGYSAFFISYVAVLSRATEWVAAVFGNVVMIFIFTSSRAWGTSFTNRLLLALVCVSVPILLVRGNSHGVGLLAGLIAAAFRFRRKGSR